MGSVGCLAKGDILFWQNILKNRSKYRGDISEQSVVCTVLISAIIIEIFRKNIPISYIIPYKKLASPLIPVCLKKSHMNVAVICLRAFYMFYACYFDHEIAKTRTHNLRFRKVCVRETNGPL